MNRRFFIIVLLLAICSVFSACKEETDLDKIQKYYNAQKVDGNFDNFSKIIVINEKGTCMSCNSRFAKKMAGKLNDTSILFIVSSAGAMIDISSYLNKEQDNFIWDPKKEFDKLNIMQSSGIIEIDKTTDSLKITEVNICNIDEIR